MSNQNKTHLIGAAILIILVLTSVSIFSNMDIVPEYQLSQNEVDNKEQIVLAVHPYDSPVEIARNFAPLINYLSEHLGKTFVLSVSKSYEFHIDRIGKDQVDIAFLGPAVYTMISERFGKKNLLCSFDKDGSKNFYGYVITRKDNPSTSLKDLEGKSFGCSSRQSTMGYILPRYLFIQAGVPFPVTQLQILKSHNNVCLNVLSGNINAGAIRENTYIKYKDRDLKVIATTPALIDHTFLATNRVDDETIFKIKEALLSINTKEDVERLLKPIKPSITSLRQVEDKDFDMMRDILFAVQKDERQTANNTEELL
ncbi:MAG: phosphate/phosphite/phosphonate ABC transporter substrate-binding protein [Bacteroidales bacterium]|nr:phosphate/phosphite/phosphonate ABC transporter substrate-binding protein [Bacteroidales bacterium]